MTTNMLKLAILSYLVATAQALALPQPHDDHANPPVAAPCAHDANADITLLAYAGQGAKSPETAPLDPSIKVTTPFVKPLTAAGLLTIAPKANTCTGAPFPAECRTAAQAAPFVTASFEKYNITHAPVQAALISLMAYETGDFKYGINHFPGVLGQGTRNMQSPNFNQEYAASLGYGADVTGDLQKMMDILTQDKFSFGSAAWFVTSQCPFSVRKAMWDGSKEAWQAYMSTCVGTDVNDERVGYWQRAMEVLSA